MIDFLVPDSGEAIEPQEQTVIVKEEAGHIDPTKVQPKPAPEASTEESISTIDFIGTVDPASETGDEPNTTNTVDNTSNVDETDYYDVFVDLAKNGYIDLDNLPEDLNTEEDTITTAEDTLKALLHNMSSRDEQIAQITQNNLLSRLPKPIQEAIQYNENKGDPLEYLKTVLGTSELTSLDPEKESDQVTIVREFYKTTDLTSEEINEKVEELKDLGLLGKEASKLKPKLDKRAEEITEKKMKAQAEIKYQKDQAAHAATTRVVDTLLKGVEGIKFNKEEAEDMLNALMIEQDFNYGTHSATKTGIEYLIDYHKYSNKGNPEKIIKALMILDPQGRYDEKLSNLYKKDLQDKFINQHITNSNNKFKQPAKTVQDKKTGNANNKTSGKFKFIKY